MAKELVAELQARLDADPALAEAFFALTPGRQREYDFHIGGAKQAATRERRLDACVPKILAGKGFRDRDDARPPLQPNADGVVLLSGGNPQIAKGDGPEPVAAYLDAMPGWKQDIGRSVDRLVEATVPGVRRAVRWNSPWYGVEGQGWFLSYHCFDRYVKVTFLNGVHLVPEPPESSKDPDARYAHVHEGEGVDEELFGDWIRQSAALPGWDGF